MDTLILSLGARKRVKAPTFGTALGHLHLRAMKGLVTSPVRSRGLFLKVYFFLTLSTLLFQPGRGSWEEERASEEQTLGSGPSFCCQGHSLSLPGHSLSCPPSGDSMGPSSMDTQLGEPCPPGSQETLGVCL